MNIRQLEQANKLDKEMIDIRNNIKKWQVATKASIRVLNEAGNYVDIDYNYVDFNILKTLTLDALNKKLEKLENEFDSL